MASGGCRAQDTYLHTRVSARGHAYRGLSGPKSDIGSSTGDNERIGSGDPGACGQLERGGGASFAASRDTHGALSEWVVRGSHNRRRSARAERNMSQLENQLVQNAACQSLRPMSGDRDTSGRRHPRRARNADVDRGAGTDEAHGPCVRDAGPDLSPPRVQDCVSVRQRSSVFVSGSVATSARHGAAEMLRPVSAARLRSTPPRLTMSNVAPLRLDGGRR